MCNIRELVEWSSALSGSEVVKLMVSSTLAGFLQMKFGTSPSVFLIYVLCLRLVLVVMFGDHHRHHYSACTISA